LQERERQVGVDKCPAVVFYDKTGAPTVYSLTGSELYYFSGDPVGYVDGDSVYSFAGKHLGWFIDGWIRDHLGEPVFFSARADGFPLRPLPQPEPPQVDPHPAPPRNAPEAKPPFRGWHLWWSTLSPEAFFLGTDPKRDQDG
jgi:hypothetical protein